MYYNILIFSHSISFVMRRSPVRVREVAQEKEKLVKVLNSVSYSNVTCTIFVFYDLF